MKAFGSEMPLSRLIACVPAALVLAAVSPVSAQEVLPKPEPPFRGTIGRTTKESKPDFPQEVQPPQGAPNVLLIMTDDVGFGASSTFGGPIPTPAFDKLAASGLRYNRFHTTALCSPTRAALLAGRNHHSAHTGVVMEFATGYPGYDSLMPKSAGTFAEILRQNGWDTAWYGKNHNVPEWLNNDVGPLDLWPTGLGFQYFYGFLGGSANDFAPPLVENTTPIEPPDDPNYFFERDLADRAIARIRKLNSIAPGRPWLAYYATGAAHAPHHAPREWIEKFRGQFDQGWDKVREETFARQKRLGVIPADARLTSRPAEIAAWESLSADQRKVYARMMEVYAGALAHVDQKIGRIVDAIEEVGDLDNTLVIYIMGDNSASAEASPEGVVNETATANGIKFPLEEVLRRLDQLGGSTTLGNYPVGWAHAMNTPFQWTKQVASHFGGTRNALVISWPARIKDRGGLRTQFHHVIDIFPTLLEAAGVKAPSVLNGVQQKPVEGVSTVYTFDHADAPSARRTQYFEMFGNRALYHDGWIASTTPKRLPWVVLGAEPNPNDFQWELYHAAEDFSQAVNLADRQPAKLKELQDLFWTEAAKYDVLPLSASFADRLDPSLRPSLARGRSDRTPSASRAGLRTRASISCQRRGGSTTKGQCRQGHQPQRGESRVRAGGQTLPRSARRRSGGPVSRRPA